MIIQCTRALLNQLGIKVSELAPAEGYEAFPQSFMAWHANMIIDDDNERTIVLMNNETKFPAVICLPSHRDPSLSEISQLIRETITGVFRTEGISQEVIDAYFEKAGELSFSKTANRSLVARLNRSVQEVEVMWEYIDKDVSAQKYISMITGRMIQMAGKNEGFYPIEKTIARFRELFGENQEIFDVDLYQLKIQLTIGNHEIWRRVLVPSTYSFQHLHNIIQTVFDWQNSHMHEYFVSRPVEKKLRIMMDDNPEMMDFVDFERTEICYERFVALEEILPEYSGLLYVYDFGDSWEHTVTFEKVVKSNLFQATFVEGIGERPPEDVGGEGGFQYYLDIMADENDPEYEEMKEWAEGQRERKFSKETINRRLNDIYKSYSYHVPTYEFINN
ncbi:hypothetical protein BEP19_15375 [Ammoniphilus oxalaticus]|uniref:Uncharacterized protein n=1 Tax=Ammoniphilus oxalaticus TaxID=66863 RepID=A0A419SDN3_9BACL|nr:plasmid pRiA4b ORF-3 family protein [Ammoniphilus oxalaticus]RKD21057.1 hypothetical protein BEP19_15375 [Ammoniphilus oxalaticus]